MGTAIGKACLNVCDPKGTYFSLNQELANNDTNNKPKILTVTDIKQINKTYIWYDETKKMFLLPEKFFLVYPNYEEDQIYMEKNWLKINLNNLPNAEFKRKKKNDVLVPEWKIIIRRGVPMNKFRKVILHMFKKIWCDNELEYKSAINAQFPEGKVPKGFKNVPTFTHVEYLEDVVGDNNFLSDEGVYEIKKMLWIIKGTEPTLQYSPMIPHIICLLILFLTEGETYCVLKMMLAESKILLDESIQFHSRQMRGLRWHLTLNQEDFEKFIFSFYENVASKSKSFVKLQNHFNKIGFDYLKMFQDWFRNLFFGWFPLPMVLRIFICYLNEGIKIYYRIGYAACRIFKRDILACKDPNAMNDMIRSKLQNKAFALSLKKIKKGFSKVEIDTSNLEKVKVHYRPYISKSSSIVKDDAFETIWEWLPSTHKISDPEQVYSSYKDGFSLRAVYSKCFDHIGSSMIVIIKSDQNTVFGAFIDEVFSCTSSKYVGSDESFVFSLYPKEKKYGCKVTEGNHLICSREYFAIGDGGDGAAIHLDEDLLNGHTYRSKTYDNDPFNGKDDKFYSEFKCLAMEVYAIE